MPPRIRPLEYDEADPAARPEYDRQIAAHGRMTNMKKTLGHSGPALLALMQWYPLRDAVADFLGDRRAILFAHAISTQTDCLICSTFFRRILKEGGENPDELSLDPFDELVVRYGRQLARDPNNVSDELYEALAEQLKPDQIVALTAFGGVMIATNIFNNALHVELDEYLWPYRKPQTAARGAT